MTIAGNEDVLRLQITVDDTCRVEALYALNYFDGVETGPVAAQATEPGELRGQISTRVEVLNLRQEDLRRTNIR